MHNTWELYYNNFLATRIKRIQTLIPLLNFKDKYVLDMGCWWGWFIKYARELGANVCGFDYKINRINDAIEYLATKDGLCLADVQRAPYRDHSFDIIFLSHVIEHVKDEYKILQEVYRVMKKNGDLIAIAPREYSFSILPFRPLRYVLKKFEYFLKKNNRYDWLKSISYSDISHYREYTKKMLVTVLQKNGFTIVRTEIVGFELPYPFKNRLSRKHRADIDRIFGDIIPTFLRSEIMIHARKQ